VKGLDVALLEANKAKATITTEDDDILEKAFAGQEPISPPESNLIPKKRTREELVRELKEKRGQIQSTDNDITLRSAEEEAKLLEDAKKAGKFKPIGFKPITEEKPKRKKAKGEAKDGERKKKMRKVGEEHNSTKNLGREKLLLERSELPKPKATTFEPPEPEPLPEDFNIFADAGEFEGLDLGEEDEEDSAQRINKEQSAVDEPSSAIPRRWVAMDEEDLPVEPPHNEPSTSTSRLPPLESGSRSPERNTISHPPEEDGMAEEKQSTRLRPLESSALPSIKDFLALQEAADAEEQRKKRKEKKKAKVNK
jgi:IK cytokine